MNKGTYNRERYLKNRERIKAASNKYYRTNREAQIKRRKKYRLENLEKEKAAQKKSYYKNRDKALALMKKYGKNNRSRISQYEKQRYHSDPVFRLRKNLRNRIRQAIKTNQKTGSVIENLGCSIEELKRYLESKFQPGMTWDNWGLRGWHIDHIKPLFLFNLNNPDEFKQAVHYTNLQPLWASDNRRKWKK